MRQAKVTFAVFAALLLALLAIITIAWPHWIELVFGVDPDQGDGTIEWLIVVVSIVSAVVLALTSRLLNQHGPTVTTRPEDDPHSVGH
jgi:hypothetical protein